MKRIRKGSYGYLRQQKKKEIAVAAGLYLLSLIIYFLGVWSTGSNKNLLTIVAILGCLPASRCAVTMIMTLRAQGCSEEAYKQIQPHTDGLPQLYDMVFTSYDKTFEIHHLAIAGNTLIGFTENPKCDAAACEKHLQTMFTQSNIKNMSFKIFRDLPKYINRLEQLKDLEPQEDITTAAFSLMKAISL